MFLSIDESGSCFVRHVNSKRYLRHFNLLSSIRQNHKISNFALKNILMSKHGYFSFCIRLEKSYLFKTFSCNGEPVSEMASRAPIKFVSIDPSHDFFVSALLNVVCFNSSRVLEDAHVQLSNTIRSSRCQSLLPSWNQAHKLDSGKRRFKDVVDSKHACA